MGASASIESQVISPSGGSGGGGGGISSINGNSNSAQTIAGGTGISVSSVGGTTTISATGGGTSFTATTTSATPVTLASIPITANTCGTFKLVGAAYRTNGADYAGFEMVCTAYNVGGVVSILGQPSNLFDVQSDGSFQWGFVASGANLVFQVAGAAGKTIDWSATLISSIAS